VKSEDLCLRKQHNYTTAVLQVVRACAPLVSNKRVFFCLVYIFCFGFYSRLTNAFLQKFNKILASLSGHLRFLAVVPLSAACGGQLV